MPSPFEATPEQLAADIDTYVDAVYSGLYSAFIAMPKGEDFVDYPVFEAGYEALKKATNGFDTLEPGAILDVVLALPICFVVLRTMLGFTPPELAYTTTVNTKVPVDQNFARSIDHKARLTPASPMKPSAVVHPRLAAMVRTAVELLQEGYRTARPRRFCIGLARSTRSMGWNR